MDLSIIVPLYNGEEFLTKLLNNIYNQVNSKLNFELIFIDDLSTDNSLSLISKYVNANHISNIVVVRHQENKGTAAARNSGLEIASGKWVQFLDSDDTLDRKYFSIITDKLQSQDDIDCYVYGAKYHFSDRIKTHRPSSLEDSRPVGYKNIVVNKIYKRELLPNFNPEFTFEDVIWLVSVINKSPRCAIIDNLYYEINRTNQNSKMASAKSNEWKKMALATINQARSQNEDARAFVLETFVGTIFADIFKRRDRLIVALNAFTKHIRFLPKVIRNGIRHIDIKDEKNVLK